MRPITLILPYYINGTMLEEQQRAWAAFPAELRAHLHVILVDDGSPSDPAAPHVQDVGLASYRLFRTKVDIRWNWLFCRNLGAEKATTDWLLLTDIDHLLPLDTLRFLVTSPDLRADDVYRLSRVDAPDLTPYKPHPNTWVLTRAMFDRIGGYDERFSGFYGSDAEFRDRVHAAARAVVMLPEALVRYPREVIADASTTRYGRKEPQDKTGITNVREARSLLVSWAPLRVTFPYEQVR
jgi:hypothetical protein